MGRFVAAVLFSIASAASAVAGGQGSSDFPQTQSNPGSGGGSPDFQQVRPQSGGMGGGSQDWGASRAGDAPRLPPPGGDHPDQGQGQGQGRQGGGQKNDGSPQSHDAMNGNGISLDRDEGGGRPTEVDLNGAKVNFSTVVDSFIAKKKGGKSSWQYAEKKGTKTKVRHLINPAVSESSIKKKSDNRYSGLVTLADADGGRPVKLEFVVDFSGSNWKVLSVKPAPAARQ